MWAARDMESHLVNLRTELTPSIPPPPRLHMANRGRTAKPLVANQPGIPHHETLPRVVSDGVGWFNI
jgi:hypothetical protein